MSNDAVTRADLRRTRLDLIRQEYEVNKELLACKPHVLIPMAIQKYHAVVISLIYIYHC